MERRGFFKGLLGAATVALMPRKAKTWAGTDIPRTELGAISMETIASGPFVCMTPVFRAGTRQRLYFTIRVKIGEKTVDFNHHGNLAEDFKDARSFMETLGYKQWIVTSALRKALDGDGR